ncbi:MAG: lysophospholipid acyltransferase family protein [Myxococcota bacterium]|jgi:1-acyl-sn-glycerol-3-phosphate acyltransferase|nr:lysophospholipid acyltransferase family protein [Myxococcota bacterium]
MRARLPQRIVLPEVASQVQALDIPFNRYGLDRYGISREHVALFFSLLGWFYRHYFKVSVYGIEHVPDRGRTMLVGNHSGGFAVDGAMVITSLILDKHPPRLALGMAEKFLGRWPIFAPWLSRVGQLTGLPEHAKQFLLDDRVLLVFPEGARGTAKLYWQRYDLVRFGTGFMRLALETGTPIVPLAFIGGGEVLPTIYNARTLGRLLGAPYVPVTPYLLAIPRPRPCHIHYGEPMVFDGDGTESDDVIEGYVAQVRSRIEELTAEGRAFRRERRFGRGGSAGGETS